MNKLTKLFQATIFILIITFGKSGYSQHQISSDQYDIYIKDTLLIDPSQMNEIQTLDVEVQKTMTFKPKTDGNKTYYFVTGEKCSSVQSKTKNLTELGRLGIKMDK